MKLLFSTFERLVLHASYAQLGPKCSLVQPVKRRRRILHWPAQQMRDGALAHKAARLLESVLYLGSLPRGDIPGLLDASERRARCVVAALTEQNRLTANSTRAPLRLAFPATLARQWTPGLFSEARE